MSITINIYYTGENGNARRFADEMIKSGTVEKYAARRVIFATNIFSRLTSPRRCF